MGQMTKELAARLPGWKSYFGYCQTSSLLQPWMNGSGDDYQAESAVARPERRKFGVQPFSHKEAKRRIAPKALSRNRVTLDPPLSRVIAPRFFQAWPYINLAFRYDFTSIRL
jgi:hypothetical protein